MRIPPRSVIALAGMVALAVPCHAGEDTPSSDGIVAVPAPEPSARELTPLFSRFAQTAQSFTLKAGYRNFRDMELQEADEFDGDTLDIEALIPLSDSLQLRLYYPYRTEGEAKLIGSGDDVDIEGDGGVLDFPSLTLEYQFKHAASAGDFNLGAYLGVGYVNEYLEASRDSPTGSYRDRYNHRGSVALFGLKADKLLNNCWTFVGNLGGRYYWESDDIHPNSDSNEFLLIDASAALLYSRSIAWIHPGIELVYQGDVSDYNSLQLVPQLLLPIGDRIDLITGVSVGLLDDGPSTEGRFQLNVRF